MSKNKIPTELKPKVTDKHRVVLAYGEVTGHAHAFYNPELVELSTDIEETKTFLTVKAPSDLQHEEHTTHRIEEGQGEVIIQAQYQMGEVRRAAD